jgi:hypothetical protein
VPRAHAAGVACGCGYLLQASSAGETSRGTASAAAAAADAAALPAAGKPSDYPYHPPRIDDVLYQAVVPPYAPPPKSDPRVRVCCV